MYWTERDSCLQLQQRPTATVASISPVVGILAGGTKITVVGENFPQHHFLMSYGEYVATSLEQCSQTTCYITTSHGDSADVAVKLLISLAFHGYEPLATLFTFTYMPNPQVNSIHPLKTLAAGGTTLTVDGEGFDLVSDPQLIVHMLHTIEDSGIQNEIMFLSSCTVNISDTLKCPTPELLIPEQFKIAFNEKNKQDNLESTTDVQTSDTDHVLEIEGESLRFYLGIKLDGDQSYTDLRKSLPEYSQIQVYISEPEFDMFENTKEVSSKERLYLTGKRLSDGLEVTDYKVTIGLGTCGIVDLSANKLICMIPDVEEGLQDENELSVLVHPGTNLSPQHIGIVNLLVITCSLTF